MQNKLLNHLLELEQDGDGRWETLTVEQVNELISNASEVDIYTNGYEPFYNRSYPEYVIYIDIYPENWSIDSLEHVEDIQIKSVFITTFLEGDTPVPEMFLKEDGKKCNISCLKNSDKWDFILKRAKERIIEEIIKKSESVPKTVEEALVVPREFRKYEDVYRKIAVIMAVEYILMHTREVDTSDIVDADMWRLLL